MGGACGWGHHIIITAVANPCLKTFLVTLLTLSLSLLSKFDIMLL